MFDSPQRGFTLVEILIAMVIISLMLGAGITMTNRYLQGVRWDRLFDRLERQFLDVNTYALAGFTKSDVGDDLAELPEMYHLYFEADQDEFGLWYIESKQRGVVSENERTISFQEHIDDLDVFPIQLNELVLREGPDSETGERRTADSVVMTWSRPFSQLSFRIFDEGSGGLDQSEEGILSSDFDLPEEIEDCQQFPKVCHLTMTFIWPETSVERSMIFDLQKGVTRNY
ncbi:MAG: prepilin-type N-terminal cleavage/methylation domain-containing protein [Candidatus Gracilibacteria bacterium]|nr:prepilin-type N-terminal cleavage/methylation domain-containing protein [bacterium]MDZ4217375.1 prepilin-type N-terminal cleavage/methylation domain-containing protein [Candidatus Gracilibacteria bacterium]